MVAEGGEFAYRPGKEAGLPARKVPGAEAGEEPAEHIPEVHMKD
jgi:hypothetical protein